MDALTAFVIDFRYAIEIMTVVIAIIIAVSSIDDLFLDLYYWFLKITGNGHVRDRERVADLDLLESIPEKPFAIMVPAWREHAVIFSMLEANSRLLRYSNHHYFVGVYQNDQATQHEVKRAQNLNSNIHMVLVPRDGPTSKADCLNEVVIAIFGYEVKNKVQFAGIAMHDGEDLIHPHELKLFNLLIEEYDFIQLPVFSFTRPLSQVISGIYMDEFAEVHTKDLVVREHLSGIIPCAGVSACFGRNALAILADLNGGETFRTNAFTEDYDIAFRVHDLGLRTTFASYPVTYTIDMSEDSEGPAIIRRALPIATREFFPSTLQASVRQRARWMIGIVFQGMSELGWRGSAGTRYFLARDRKSIITGPTVILGYFVFAYILLIELYLNSAAPNELYSYALLYSPWMVTLFLINLGFLLWRLGQRMYFTTKIYDWRQGLMSAPRLIVANFVNFFATFRAVRIYYGHRFSGKPLVWDKTAHSYPFKLTQSPAE